LTDAAAPYQAQLRRAQSALPVGRWSEVIEQGGLAFEGARAASDGTAAVEAAQTVAKAMFNTDRLDDCEAWCGRASQVAEAMNAPVHVASTLVLAAAGRARAGRTAAALEAVAGALGLLEGEPDAQARRLVYFGVAITYRALGLWRHAVGVWQAAVEADRVLATESAAAALARINLAECAVRAHDDLREVDPEAARRVLQPALALREEIAATREALPAGWLRFLSGQVLGGLHVCLGEYAAARTLLEQTLAEEGQERIAVRGSAWMFLALARQHLGEHEAARDAAREACLRLAQDIIGGTRPLPGLHDHWRAAQLLGDGSEALALLAQLHVRQVAGMQALVDAQVAGLARHISAQTLAMQNADLREHNAGLARDIQHISQAAQTDALTGVLNRRALEVAFATLQQRGRLVLAMIDVDHFKQVNDSHSHVVGDAVLHQVAVLLGQGLRGEDRIARFGGEEFAVLLADLRLEEGSAVVERLRQRVAAQDWSVHAQGLVVTVSAGVVPVGAHEKLEDAVRRADRLLYRAKAGGRNRVLAAPV
jgi:diguanylate cyclase (GGDEF)-like protein